MVRALLGELGRTLFHVVELPWHTGMFSLICSMGQVVFQEATKSFKKYFSLQLGLPKHIIR